jgi:hypothetical protein
MLVRNMSCWSRICHVGQEYVMLVKNMSCSSRICHDRQEYVMLVKNMSCSSRIYHVRQEYIMFVKKMSCWSGICHVGQEYIMLKNNRRNYLKFFSLRQVGSGKSGRHGIRCRVVQTVTTGLPKVTVTIKLRSLENIACFGNLEDQLYKDWKMILKRNLKAAAKILTALPLLKMPKCGIT